MNLVVLLTAVCILVTSATPAVAQSKGGGIGGVLDTLGGLLGTSQKLHGTVVLSRDTTLVLRADDGRTYRIDTAGIDPQVRRSLQPGQTVTVVTKGGGTVLSAAEIQPDAAGAAKPAAFSRVSGTIQEGGESRILFRTREGLVLPVDTSQIRGLPYFAANEPATLIYEQGPRQEIKAVWIEPGADQAASAPSTPGQPTASPSAAVPAGAQRVQGMVESVGLRNFRLQTNDGRTLTVEADANTLTTVRPGDVVTVTGQAGAQTDTFIAQAIEPENRAR
jgi:hypothetical protein